MFGLFEVLIYNLKLIIVHPCFDAAAYLNILKYVLAIN